VRKRLGDTTHRISPATFRQERVGSLARREPTTVDRAASLDDAIGAMQAGATRSVLVTEGEGRLVGILTERDIVGRVLAVDPAPDGAAAVERYMSPIQDALSLDAELGQALELMAKGGYQGVPLVDDGGRVAGHLDGRDVLEYLAEAFPQEVLNLPPRPHQLMEQPEGA
jgi:CBS domain-containing protein